MFDPTAIYLRNLAKRGLTNEHVSPAEIVYAPKLIDQRYGDGNGVLDIHDVDDIASNVAGEVVDKVGEIIDFFTSIF